MLIFKTGTFNCISAVVSGTDFKVRNFKLAAWPLMKAERAPRNLSCYLVHYLRRIVICLSVASVTILETNNHFKDYVQKINKC